MGKKTKVVLEEEEYVEALGQIIERDFFPDLPDLKRQTALLRGDEGETPLADMTLRAVSRRGSASVRSNASGMGWDDPTPNPEPAAGDEEEEETKSEATGAMTLNAFVATHTSEDNESFNELQKKTVKEHQRRYHWAFDDDKEKGDPKLHLLTDGTWISKERRQIADDACAPKGLKDSRPVVPESWRYRARNPLLFPPELEATRDICRVEARGNQLLLENGPKSRLGRPPKAKKKTVYANSRFPAEEKLPSGADAGHGNSTPLKDYSLVPMTPLIAPGIDASPLMTWGDIEGTPMILGSRATPERILNTPTFEVKDTSRREKLAHRLETEARHRSSKSRTPGRRTPSRKIGTIEQTPVSRSVRARLSSARSVLRTPLGSDAQLRASYSTPSRPPRHSSTKAKMT